MSEKYNDIAVCPQLVDDVDDDDDMCGVDLGDGIRLINTQEDMYLYALLELYKLFCKLS